MRGLFLLLGSSFGDWERSIADVEADNDVLDDIWLLCVPATTTFEDDDEELEEDDFEGAWLFFIFKTNGY